jgi:hypothetical protein
MIHPLHVSAEHSCVETETVPWAQSKLPLLLIAERHAKPRGIVNTSNEAMEGLYPVPVPPPVRRSHSLDLEPDRRLSWKPPRLKEKGRCLAHVVRIRSSGMSRIDSPRLEMALTPLNPLLDVPPPLSGLEPDRRLCWKPPDLKELRRQAINIVRLGNNGMSRAYSPRVKTVIMPFASHPPYPHHPQELWDIIITDGQCAGGMSLVSMCDHKAEGSRLEPLPAPCCHPWLSRLDRRIPRKLLDVEMRERCPTNRHVISMLQKESALAHLNLSPFTRYVVRACPICYPQPSSFKHNRRLSRKPPGLMGMG